jgi:glycosyltransferase involved in cell wall biosynthesis
MKRQIVVVPCYKVQDKVEGVINEIKGKLYDGFTPIILAYVDGSPDLTFAELRSLQKERNYPEIILSGKKNVGLSGGMKRSFKYLLGSEPEDVEILDKDGLKGCGPECPLITIIGGDGQQSFWEIFGEAGIVVYSGKAPYGFMERWNRPGDLNPDKQIKMPKERIEKEVIINRIAYAALQNVRDYLPHLISEEKNENIGPDPERFVPLGRVRDLQTNKSFSGKKLERIFNEMSGDKRYAFDLDVALIAGKEGEPIYWGVRKDYGMAAPLGEGWKERWGNSAQDKFFVVQKHSKMTNDRFEKLITYVVWQCVSDELSSLEIGKLVEEYATKYFSGAEMDK